MRAECGAPVPWDRCLLRSAAEGVVMAFPTDRLLAEQWHLFPADPRRLDLDVLDAWRPAEGPGYSGAGTRTVVIDDGFDYWHHDLARNYDADLDRDFATGTDDAFGAPFDAHGTAVAGLIGAAANGRGAVGVAHRTGLRRLPRGLHRRLPVGGPRRDRSRRRRRRRRPDEHQPRHLRTPTASASPPRASGSSATPSAPRSTSAATGSAPRSSSRPATTASTSTTPTPIPGPTIPARSSSAPSTARASSPPTRASAPACWSRPSERPARW